MRAGNRKPCLIMNGRGFWQLYEQACFQSGIACSSRVRKAIDNEVCVELDLNLLKEEQWSPVLEALANCDSLREIGIVNRPMKVLHGPGDNVTDDEEERGKQIICQKLMKAVSVHLWNSMTLTHLYLKNLGDLVLHVNFLKSNKFVKSLSRNDSLRNLWIENCRLSESDIHAICKALRLSTLTNLAFVQCGINHKTISAIISLLKRQNHKRSNNISRCHMPTVERAMPGLRRINLSRNPQIGVKGFFKLCRSLETDSWIRAVDIHECSLTDQIWSAIEALIQRNTKISLIDVRFNGLNERLVAELVCQLQRRQNVLKQKFEWQPSLHYSSPACQLQMVPIPDDEKFNRPRNGKRLRINDDNLDYELRCVADRRIRQLEDDVFEANERCKVEFFNHKRTRDTLQHLLIELRKVLQSKQILERRSIEDIYESAISSCKWLRMIESELSPTISTSDDDSATEDAAILRNLLSGIEKPD